jgi:hypothetical protein
MTGISTSVLYIVLVAVELLLPGGEPPNYLQIDYLQDGMPAAVIEVSELPSAERDLFLIRAVMAGADGEDGVEQLYRIEQSDIDSTNYLLYGPGGGVPTVLSLAPALAGFPAVVSDADYLLTIESGEQTSGSVEGSLPGSLYVLPRAPYLLLSDPASATILIVEAGR